MRRPLYLLPVAALLGLSALPLLPPIASATDGTIPGGTSISVTIDSPADGASLPPGPVTLTGQSSIGAGRAVPNTGIVYVFDVSGSTTATGACGGDENADGTSGDTLDCEIAAAKRLNEQAVDTGTVGKVSAVAFGTNAAVANVNAAQTPRVTAIAPNLDANHNSFADIVDVLSSVYNRANGDARPSPPGGIGLFTPTSVNGSTSFFAGVNATVAALTSPDMNTPSKIVVFMSDGANTDAGDLEAALSHVPNGVPIETFAIGTNSECGSTAENAVTLGRIATVTHGTCTPVRALSDLPSVIPAVIQSHLDTLTLRIDTDDSQPGTRITNTTLQDGTPAPLPRTGPTTVNYSVTTPPLAPGNHRLCVRADGSAALGGGFVEECHTVHINEPPVVSAGGSYSGAEDNPISIVGSVSDPDGPFPTSTSWSILPASGIPPGTNPVCTFGDAGAVSTTVTCSERGTYTLTLTASDGLHPPVSSSTTVTFINQAPKVSAGGPYRGNEDNAVPIAGTVTDPDGPSLTTRWSIEAETGVPTPFNCTFGDAAALSTTVTCDQRGTYLLTLTANDSVNAPVSATAEVTFVNVPPTVSAGGPYKGNEDNQVPIAGTATDPDGPPLTSTWTIEPVNDGSVPEGSVCTFANPNALSTTVSCTERGNYTLTLTVTDGVNQPVTATATLTLVNVPSTVSAGGPYTGEEDHPVAITGTVVDPDSPGLTTTWTIKPNLGTAICSFIDPSQLSTVVTCSEPGVYTLTLTADDPADGNPAVVATAVVSLSLTPGALSLISSVAPAPGFVGGDAIVVTQTVHNAGPAAMPGVRLVTTLPTGMQPTAVDRAGCTAASCDLGTLAPGQTVQVKFSFSPSATVDTLVSATVTTPGPDLDRGDNSGSVRVIVRQPTLTIDPSTGPQGFVTHATGKDFPPGARVRLQWSIGISETPGEVTVRPDGTLDAQALVFPKDVRGLRNLQAVPVSGPNFGMVTSNPFLVFLPSLKPLSFVIR